MRGWFAVENLAGTLGVPVDLTVRLAVVVPGQFMMLHPSSMHPNAKDH